MAEPRGRPGKRTGLVPSLHRDLQTRHDACIFVRDASRHREEGAAARAAGPGETGRVSGNPASAGRGRGWSGAAASSGPSPRPPRLPFHEGETEPGCSQHSVCVL